MENNYINDIKSMYDFGVEKNQELKEAENQLEKIKENMKKLMDEQEDAPTPFKANFNSGIQEYEEQITKQEEKLKNSEKKYREELSQKRGGLIRKLRERQELIAEYAQTTQEEKQTKINELKEEIDTERNLLQMYKYSPVASTIKEKLDKDEILLDILSIKNPMTEYKNIDKMINRLKNTVLDNIQKWDLNEFGIDEVEWEKRKTEESHKENNVLEKPSEEEIEALLNGIDKPKDEYVIKEFTIEEPKPDVFGEYEQRKLIDLELNKDHLTPKGEKHLEKLWKIVNSLPENKRKLIRAKIEKQVIQSKFNLVIKGKTTIVAYIDEEGNKREIVYDTKKESKNTQKMTETKEKAYKMIDEKYRREITFDDSDLKFIVGVMEAYKNEHINSNGKIANGLPTEIAKNIIEHYIEAKYYDNEYSKDIVGGILEESSLNNKPKVTLQSIKEKVSRIKNKLPDILHLPFPKNQNQSKTERKPRGKSLRNELVKKYHQETNPEEAIIKVQTADEERKTGNEEKKGYDYVD